MSGSGAAAESEPSTTYNVREYQNPDAGALDQPLTKVIKGNGKTKPLSVCFPF